MAIYKDGQWFSENFQEATADGLAKFLGPIIAFVIIFFFIASNIVNFLILIGVFLGGKILRMAVGGAPWFVRFPVWLVTWVLFIASIFYVVNSGRFAEDPVINAYATVADEYAGIENLNKLTGLTTEISRPEVGTQLRVLGTTRNHKYLIVETTDDKGKTIKGYYSGLTAPAVAETYTLSLWKRFFHDDAPKFKKIPYFLKEGTYTSDVIPDYYFTASNGKKRDNLILRVTNRTDERIMQSWGADDLIKAEPPIEINGSLYNYKFVFYEGTEEEYLNYIKETYRAYYKGSTDEEIKGTVDKFVPVPFPGEYVITSNTSFVGPGGVTWTLSKAKK